MWGLFGCGFDRFCGGCGGWWGRRGCGCDNWW
jgi:hypothetical protein